MSIQIKPDVADRIKVSDEAYRPEPRRSAKRNWRLIGGGAVVAALAVAAISAAVGWPFGGAERVAQTQADAPLIKADEGPVKVRPEDPGGMQVPNRDMLVYRRLEGAKEPPPVERLLPNPEQPVLPPKPVAAPGREIEATDAESAPADEEAEAVAPPAEGRGEERIVAPEPPQVAPPPPEPVKVAKPKPTPVAQKPAAPAPSPAPAAGVYQVQLVAVRTRDQAWASWSQISKKHADVLGGLKPNIVRADLGGKGVIYRLRAGPAGDESKARSICASLAKRKVDCLVVRPSG